jgi:hypothetical protein
MNTPNFNMFPMVERRYFKTIDVEMHAIIEWWGYSNRLQYYKIYGMVMKMLMTKFLSNQPWKHCIDVKDVDKEIH